MSNNKKYFDILDYNEKNIHVDINDEIIEIRDVETLRDVVLDKIIEIKINKNN